MAVYRPLPFESIADLCSAPQIAEIFAERSRVFLCERTCKDSCAPRPLTTITIFVPLTTRGPIGRLRIHYFSITKCTSAFNAEELSAFLYELRHDVDLNTSSKMCLTYYYLLLLADAISMSNFNTCDTRAQLLQDIPLRLSFRHCSQLIRLHCHNDVFIVCSYLCCFPSFALIIYTS